ncbi:MAG: hypothetical protein JSU63_18365 [Phycisphaerales bacterium]|nr:MAG: hypothetical protein JSU63_18365 [Phycisphaerales bacterium]
MKATRRHELKENDLSHMIEVARTYMTDHGTKVGLLVLLVLAVIVVVSISVRTKAANTERTWLRRTQLSFDTPEDGKASIDKLRAMLVDAPDESFVFSSLMEQGSQALRLAQEVEIPPDPELNDRAREAFESLLARFPDNPIAFGLAHTGLATVEENDFALDSRSAHKARAAEHLQAVVDHPALNSLPFHLLASTRLEKLEDIFTVVRFADPEVPEDEEEPEDAVPVDEADPVDEAVPAE